MHSGSARGPAARDLASCQRAARESGLVRLSVQSLRPGGRPGPSSGRRQTRAGCAAVVPPRLAVEAALQKEDTWSLEDAADLFTRDEIKERGRRHMRSLSTFTFERWAFHRSTSRYIRHMTGIFQSHIVWGLAPSLLSAGCTATLICLYETLLREGVLPEALPSLMMPPLPFDFTAFALSLLLVFRTNTSYDRWLQAVTTWGGITNRSKDTLRQLLAYSSSSSFSLVGVGGGVGKDPTQSAAGTSRWLVAFARSLKAQVTEDSDLQTELQFVLTPQEVALLMAAQHRPSFALAVLSELMAGAPVRDTQRIRLDENMTYFQDCLGTCERIFRTPIPLSYTRHTSRFMVIWLSFLPLGLWDACGWGTVPLTVIISFLLLGIEEIGVAIEEPFSILPLEEFCRELEFGLSSILEQADSSKVAAKQAAAAALAAAGGTAAPAPSTAASSSPTGSAGRAGGSGPAPAVGNAVAPFLPGTARSPRDLALSSADLAADAIFSSIDESDS